MHADCHFARPAKKPQEIRDIKKFLEFARRPDAKGEQQQQWHSDIKSKIVC